MRTALLFLLCSATVSLPLHAAPPPAAAAPTPAPPTTPASHSRLGEIMGSLTRALQDASEQRAHPGKPEATSLDTTTAQSSATPSPTPLPPDATAQAVVP